MVMSRFISWLSKVRRWYVQLGSAVFFNSFSLQGFKRLPCPALNCHACPLANFGCPIGVIQHFGTMHQVPWFTIGVLGVVGVLIGRLACGWFCPFGFLQDLLYRIKVNKVNLSNRYANWIRYGVLLVLVIVVPIITLDTWFCKLCPAGSLEGGIPWVVIDPGVRQLVGWRFWGKITILIVFIVGMVFVKRPFCRFVCPLGAIYSLFNKVSAVRLVVDQDKCIKCDLCKQVCPMDIAVYLDANSPQCIRCMECAKVCPVDAIT